MNPLWRDHRFLIVGAVVLGVLAGALVFWWTRPEDENREDPVIEPPPVVDDEEVERREVELYFPGEDGRLHPMTRELPVGLEPTENISRLVQALLEGPHREFAADSRPTEDYPSEDHSTEDHSTEDHSTEDHRDEASPGPPVSLAPVSLAPVSLADLEPENGLWPPFPANVALGRAYLFDDATVLLDLVSTNGTRPAAGSRAEVLMLYSLVNTVLLNTEEAERLVLLWNGRQPSTFTGHFDTTRPLRPRPELIAR